MGYIKSIFKYFILFGFLLKVSFGYGQTVYSEDFNSGLSGWTLSSTGSGTGAWINGSNSAHRTGSNGKYMYSARYGGYYNDHTYVIAESPTINALGYTNLNLEMDVWYMAEYGYDVMQVQYSLNNGAWKVLGKSTKSGVTGNPNWYTPTENDGLDGWSSDANVGKWVTRQINLSAEDTGFNNNSNIKLRVIFSSDELTTFAGVAFDNILIQGNNYCASSAYSFSKPTWSDDIRRVQFNTIDNATSDYASGYSDFTNISTTVAINGKYDLSVYVNTSENERNNETWRYNVYAWIDWNQDGDFNDSNESYNLGSATNSAYAQPNNSPYSIIVPAGAKLGTTRMRITEKYNATAAPCDNSFHGEVEDYTINVINAAPYCTPLNINNYNTYFISNVSLGILNNTTNVGTGNYSNFTSLTPNNVSAGGVLNGTISVKLNGWNTDTYDLNVWIDFNQDLDFNDPGENYLVKVRDLNNVGGIKTVVVPVSIPISASASLGNTRMRIGFVDSVRDPKYSVCDFVWDSGEVEDYTINILAPSAAITTGTISPTSYCAGSSVSVPFTKTGTFNSGNIFTAQLSNASGSFASPVTIGTLNSTGSGTISGVIPVGTATGSGYRIRVISSNPAIVGTANSSNLNVNAIPSAPIVGNITHPTCLLPTGSVVLNGLPATPWTLTRSPGNVITAGSGTSSTISGLNPGTYTYTVNYSGLTGEYFNNKNLSGSPVLTRTDATVNFDWGGGNPGSPINNDNFSVRWSGQVQPLYTENYTFSTRSDDGIRLWVNGVQIINNWTDHGPTVDTGTINLVAGQKYAIVLEYYEYTGGAVAELSWSSASQSLQIIPQSQLFPSTCASPSSANVVINSIPTAPPPTTTGGQICIGSSATLSASGAASGGIYKWYNAATSGTLLKTSANNTDNTFVTPTLGSTTNYWVSITNASGCESPRTIVTATFPLNSTDSQITVGNNSWIGHVYDGTNAGIPYNGNFTNYYGSVTELEEFNQTFGGDYNCYAINSTSPLGSRSIYTETFSVRYRMNSTRKGLYLVDLGSDDGSRLQVDGTLVYDDWVLQGFGSGNPRVLMSLTGNSSLIYDFYENNGGNQVRFNNLVRVIENTLNTNTTQNICLNSTGVAISGDTFGVLPSGISLAGTGYQWAYSSSITGPWIDISGATTATFTPSGMVAPFNAGGTFYLIRKAKLSSANNVAPNPYVATNNSNVATVNVASTVTWTGAVSKDWNTDANWSCGGVPTITTNVLIPAGVTNYPEIASTDAGGLANNIEIETGATLTVFDNSIKVDGTLLLNGVIDLEGEGQLIQNTGSVLNPTSKGSIEIDQQGTASTYAYNYWGSPVGTTLTGTNSYSYKLEDILYDGATPVKFISGYNGKTSPISIANYWIYKYTKATNTGGYSDWQAIGSTGNLDAGQGFTMKGPNSSAAITVDQNYTFKGKPNNGTIALAIKAGNEYLLGNPYPSAIDINNFFQDNPFMFDGYIRFWEQFDVKSHNLANYEGVYWLVNISGGVPTSFTPSLINQNPTSVSKKTPASNIPVAQGFFIKAVKDGVIQFTNNQRVFVTESSGDAVFMKLGNSKSKAANVSIKEQDGRTKIRLGFKAPKLNHRQLLLTIDERATDGVDWGFDGEMSEVLVDDMYWTLADKKYVIQATNSFSLDKEMPLGITTKAGGLVSIQIDALENVDNNVELFIKDALVGKTYKINNQPFEIELAAGTYTDRFSLVFAPQETLDLEDEILKNGVLVFMNNTAGEIQIKNTIQAELLSVNLYNSLGQELKVWTKNLEDTQVVLPVNNMATGMYVVQVKTSTGTITKKIIIE
ncbi:T9SS C-terminal target domain-containing protein [Lutibacter sp. HS1-25]|uniref:PA14 domain-containing protein n=1 Tax=Lutibacter sp. HS1-25 TaxID=2485000 RepID=UPI0010121804|nr:PA14 domain-containing protein [Lutibacter sp. HS1-25]RXP53811.1 T9SS C-terminal target domain-containing protein [Lutibacter sp. HS1-25]